MQIGFIAQGSFSGLLWGKKPLGPVLVDRMSTNPQKKRRVSAGTKPLAIKSEQQDLKVPVDVKLKEHVKAFDRWMSLGIG